MLKGICINTSRQYRLLSYFMDYKIKLQNKGEKLWQIMKFVTTFDLTKILFLVVDTRCSGGQIGDSVIPGYVDALLSEKASILNPMLFGVVDEQAEIIEEEEGVQVVKNIKMFLATAL